MNGGFYCRDCKEYYAVPHCQTCGRSMFKDLDNNWKCSQTACNKPVTSTKSLAERLIQVIGLDKILNPQNLSINIDIAELYLKDPDLARDLITPLENFVSVETTIREMIRDHYKNRERYHLRIFNLPNMASISDLCKQSYEGKIAQFRGIITQVAPIRKLISEKVYECKFCGDEISYKGTNVQEMLNLPKRRLQFNRCESCNCQTPKTLKDDRCLFVPTQRLILQELLEEMVAGKTPAKIIAYCLDDLASDLVRVGDQVTIVGVIRPDIREQYAIYSVYAEVISLLKLKASYEEVKLTIEDMELIMKLAQNPNIYDILIKSFAPTIYGYRNPKLALLCSLFGSPRLTRNSTEIRGNIHCILTGDTSTAKSKMILYAANVSPRGVTAHGSRATSAGLTCSWARGRDNLPELQPGAMVMADGDGIVCLDEMDKVSPTDLHAIHGPMEDQILDVAMGGVQQRFQTRCAVIAAANPKHGKYDPEKTIEENINLDPPLLSRFDLIFVIRDKPEKATEEALATHILDTHSGHSRHGPLTMEQLRKYISYAKRIEPELIENGEAYNTLRDGYLKNRLLGGRDRMSVVPRQLDSLVRISKALARMQLSKEVRREHAEMALKLYEQSTKISTLASEEPILTSDIKPAIEAQRPTAVVNKEEKIWLWILGEAQQNNGKINKRKIRNMAFQLEDILDDLIEKKTAEKRIKDLDEDHWILTGEGSG